MFTTQRTAELATLAFSIINEGVTVPCGMVSLYDAADWTAAAEYAIDSDDYEELDFMLRRDEALENFHETRCPIDADVFEAFEAWTERFAA